ncbi:site-specific integrase [Nesterenkonia sp. CL21]|uniref:site-specific integrase n=1 Tax=Nesterenkonia sp. CL21 TaxID=3064894 RepID=UPI00287A3545|nr:site-specific integrase [Nesterenkonia sp. CL21]MDS2171577.1 site-specific integrase [Nesterenkonia sp. CL21]
MRLRLIDSNPVLGRLGKQEGLPSPRRKRPHSPLTMSQLKRLAGATGEWEGLILLAGTSGPRWGELTALRGGDVRGDRLRIERAWSNVHGRLELGQVKSKEPRTVPILPSVAEKLPEVDPMDLLWRGPRGGVLRNGWFRERVLEPAIEECQAEDPLFPSIVIHDLRHTAVSIAIASGANVKVVQRLAGHATAMLTLDTYGGMFDRDLFDMAGQLDAAYRAA